MRPASELGAAGRDEAAVRRHYEVERELADRLRSAGPDERRRLYGAVYDELFRRVPDHPQLVRKRDPESARRETERLATLVMRYAGPDARVLDVGAGECRLAATLASRVREVVALDVSDVISRLDEPPSNLTLALTDGVAVPVEPASVDVAVSNQVMEHLHPDDALEQLRGIRRALAPGGHYLCITPNRLSGPHDVSRYFDDVPRGFHLREYTAGDLAALFRRAGFRRARVLLASGRRPHAPVTLPVAVIRPLEAVAAAVRPFGRQWTRRPPWIGLLGIVLVARA